MDFFLSDIMSWWIIEQVMSASIKQMKTPFFSPDTYRDFMRLNEGVM